MMYTACETANIIITNIVQFSGSVFNNVNIVTNLYRTYESFCECLKNNFVYVNTQVQHAAFTFS